MTERIHLMVGGHVSLMSRVTSRRLLLLRTGPAAPQESMTARLAAISARWQRYEGANVDQSVSPYDDMHLVE
jgi:hypothetical protein